MTDSERFPLSLAQLVGDVAESRAELSDLIQALEPLIRDQAVLPPDVSLQLTTALLEIEQTAVLEDQLQRLVTDQAAPTLAINEAGQILALNQEAVRLFACMSGDGLTALGISREQFRQFRQRLQEASGSSLLQAFAFDGGHQHRPIVLVGSYQHRLRAFVLMALQQHWPASLNRALRDMYGLSQGECDVLALLAGGMVAEQIASQRGSKISTVRQQIKTILAKLGAQSSTQVATLAAAAAAAMSDTPRARDALPSSVEDWPLHLGEFYRLGRRVGWRRFGDPKGQKVLLLHGPTFGAGEYLADRRLARQMGLDVVALERPGYGRTDVPHRQDDPLQVQVDDALHLLQQLEFSPVVLLAHEVGLITALALSSRLPRPCAGIVSVSAAPPFRQQQQINAMPAHQGIFIQAARHAPWLARLLIRLLMVRTRKLGPERWTDVVFEGVEPDHGIIIRPDLRAGVIGTYSFNLNQMGAGFEVDLRVMLQDWESLLHNLPVSLILLHGEQNATTAPAVLGLFRNADPAAVIELVEGEGLTLAVSQPELIWRRVKETAQRL